MAAENPTWTFPTRFCRICMEDVPPTVSYYPPGVPMKYQRVNVEYKNADEYGRLMKPCLCKGSLRYIHELCLLRSRTENQRKDSMWQCHTCGYKFNFNKLTLQRFLTGRFAISGLTIGTMLAVMFLLGFIADPIINIYLDPYDTITGRESVWGELEVHSWSSGPVTRWTQHFAKGFISMGLVGFLKTMLLNPLQWLNLRWGTSSGARTTTTGRDRAVNISWIAVVIGVASAFAFFYKFVQAFVQRGLQKLGNNIVDTQLQGDDDDLKPPPGWKPYSAKDESRPTMPEPDVTDDVDLASNPRQEPNPTEVPLPSASASEKSDLDNASQASRSDNSQEQLSGGSWTAVDRNTDDLGNGEQDVVVGAHRQGWSFENL